VLRTACRAVIAALEADQAASLVGDHTHLVP